MALEFLKEIGITISPDAKRAVKVTAYSFLIKQITGEDPIVTDYANYTQIDFTDSQIIKLQEHLRKLHDGEPTDVRLNVRPIFQPFYLKRYAPWLAGLAGGGFFLGWLLKR